MALLGVLQERLSTEVQENAPLETLLNVPPHWEELAFFFFHLPFLLRHIWASTSYAPAQDYLQVSSSPTSCTGRVSRPCTPNQRLSHRFPDNQLLCRAGQASPFSRLCWERPRGEREEAGLEARAELHLHHALRPP